MNLEHLSTGRRDGLRDARRRRRPHRRHDLPDVPRPPPPRGHERHRAARGSPRRVFRHAGLRARASSSTPTSSPRARPAAARQLGLPGQRDQHAGCVGAYLVEHDLFDFLLLSLPDNDTHSHKNGPYAQVASIAAADRQLERLMHAAGGPEAFLEDHAMIVCSDHSQSQVEAEIDLFKAFDGFGVLEPPMPTRARSDGEPPRSRSARRRARRRSTCSTASAATSCVPRIERTALRARGRRPRDAPDRPPRRRGGDPRRRAASCASRPAASCVDRRGERWSVEGDLELLGLDGARTACCSRADVPGRARARVVGAALPQRRRGAAVGRARLRVHRLGRRRTTSAAASHGSLHANDSLGALLWCGTGPDARDARDQWSLRDIVPMVREHFGVRCVRAPSRLCSSRSLAPRRPRPRRSRRPRDYAAPPPGWRMAPADVLRAVAARPEVRRARREARADLRRASTTRAAPSAAGRCRSSPRPGARAQQGDRADRRRRPQRARARELDGLQGGVDDGARLRRARSGAIANALWIWLPLCVLFVLPFARAAAAAAAPRPARCCSRSRSPTRSSTRRDIDVSVPLVYPLLVYLLVRMLVDRARAARREPQPLRLLVPAAWLGIAAVFLLGFRCGLNVVDSNVIDVGYAGVIGADQLRLTASRCTAHFPPDNAARRHLRPGHLLRLRAVRAAAAVERAAGTTCRPRTPPRSRSTCCRRRGCGCSAGACAGRTLGRRCSPTRGRPSRSRCSSPNSNANDALVALLVPAAMLAAGAPGGARGALGALAGADEVRAARARAAVRDLPRRRGRGAPRASRSAAAFAASPRSRSRRSRSATASRTFCDRTLGFQADRGSPFSIWGLYGGLDRPQRRAGRRARRSRSSSPSCPRRRDLVDRRRARRRRC